MPSAARKTALLTSYVDAMVWREAQRESHTVALLYTPGNVSHSVISAAQHVLHSDTASCVIAVLYSAPLEYDSVGEYERSWNECAYDIAALSGHVDAIYAPSGVEDAFGDAFEVYASSGCLKSVGRRCAGSIDSATLPRNASESTSMAVIDRCLKERSALPAFVDMLAPEFVIYHARGKSVSEPMEVVFVHADGTYGGVRASDDAAIEYAEPKYATLIRQLKANARQAYRFIRHPQRTLRFRREERDAELEVVQLDGGRSERFAGNAAAPTLDVRRLGVRDVLGIRPVPPARMFSSGLGVSVDGTYNRFSSSSAVNPDYASVIAPLIYAARMANQMRLEARAQCVLSNVSKRIRALGCESDFHAEVVYRNALHAQTRGAMVPGEIVCLCPRTLAPLEEWRPNAWMVISARISGTSPVRMIART